MKAATTRIIALLAAATCAACAGVDFKRVPNSELFLGKTTRKEIVARMGAPQRKLAATVNAKQVKSLIYSYSAAVGEAVHYAVIPTRVQGFLFLDDTLVGHDFVSSWKVDGTDFEGELAKKIEKGVTTRSEVVALLGEPVGRWIYPLIDVETDTAISYEYTEVYGGNPRSIHSKTLKVVFDQNDVVTKVEYTEVGDAK